MPATWGQGEGGGDGRGDLRSEVRGAGEEENEVIEGRSFELCFDDRHCFGTAVGC